MDYLLDDPTDDEQIRASPTVTPQKAEPSSNTSKRDNEVSVSGSSARSVPSTVESTQPTVQLPPMFSEEDQERIASDLRPVLVDNLVRIVASCGDVLQRRINRDYTSELDLKVENNELRVRQGLLSKETERLRDENKRLRTHVKALEAHNGEFMKKTIEFTHQAESRIKRMFQTEV